MLRVLERYHPALPVAWVMKGMLMVIGVVEGAKEITWLRRISMQDRQVSSLGERWDDHSDYEIGCFLTLKAEAKGREDEMLMTMSKKSSGYPWPIYPKEDGVCVTRFHSLMRHTNEGRATESVSEVKCLNTSEHGPIYCRLPPCVG